MSNEEHKVHESIAANKQIAACTKMIVAVSGGADSVCLLRALLSLPNKQLAVAHCNFQLRGEESNRDEQFVRQLCETLGVPLHIATFDTYKEAASNSESIEMAARRLRYTWFEELRKQLNYDIICVAHNADDSIETMLLNLLRGSGLAGLCGIGKANGHICRPLLPLHRTDIEAYLQAIGQDYITDSSNADTRFRRNKVRHELLPLMEQINPSIRTTLLTTMQHLEQANTIYQQQIRLHIDSVCSTDEAGCRHISINKLNAFPSPEAILHEILAPLGFNATQEIDILQSTRTGATIHTDQWQLLRDNNELLLLPIAATAPLPTFSVEQFKITPNTVLDYSNPTKAYMDADVLNALPDAPLSMRRIKAGDKFIPYGMQGTKLISDLLREQGYNIHDKQQACLLCKGDEILWLVGVRLAHPYRITPNTTNVVCVSYDRQN